MMDKACYPGSQGHIGNLEPLGPLGQQGPAAKGVHPLH